MTEDRNGFRYTIGIIAILGGLGGLAGLYFVEVPEGNREPLLLALGLVLGWGATVIGYEFGSSPSGRKAAYAGIAVGRKAMEGPTGRPNDPVHVDEERRS
jgi:hypothetical protein